MVTTDLTARVAELTASIAAHLAEDEATAKRVNGVWIEEPESIGVVLVGGEPLIEGHVTGLTAHITRNDPARILRRVKAVRDLVAAITAERHDYNALDGYYSCSRAEDPDPCPGEGGPGSGCSDPERRGKPCDCGRDSRVARLLGIIASEWEDA